MTAKLLKDVGYRVTILEGSDRLGGRIQTHRDQRDGWMAEMGPMRYPESQVYTRTLANHFGLRMEPFVTEKSIRAVFMRNQRWSDSLIRQRKDGKGFAGSQQSCLMIPRLESPSIRNATHYDIIVVFQTVKVFLRVSSVGLWCPPPRVATLAERGKD